MKSVSHLVLLVTILAVTDCFFDRDRITSSRRRLQSSSPEDPTNSFVNMKVPSSIYELSSPVDYLSQGATTASPSGILQIDPLNHDANYIKIADELKRYEDAYATCINSLSDNDFSDETVDNCVGINYNYVFDDCDYEKSKILARADSALRDFMIQNCYTVAGVDLVLSNACDLVETDALTLLWNELNFAGLLDYHRNKYLFEYAFMNETTYNGIIAEFQIIWKETNNLLTELYDHRQLTVSHLEDLISRRTSEILQAYQGESGYTTTTHVISFSSDDDWRKKNRSLGTQGKDTFRPPMSRFLELNPKNMKVREQLSKDEAADKVTKQSGGKIAVDEPTQAQKKDV
jgi:hypothetical protein